MPGNPRLGVHASGAQSEDIDLGARSKYSIAMSSPDIQPEDIELVTLALQSKILSLGPFLSDFEHAFADYIGTDHAIGVAL